MLLLVLGDNFIVMFFGWRSGLCSYLLIGFWYKDYKKATAGMKAFIVNRIGASPSSAAWRCSSGPRRRLLAGSGDFQPTTAPASSPC